MLLRVEGNWIYSGLGFCQEVRTDWACGKELRVCAGGDKQITRRGKREVRNRRLIPAQ